MILLGSKPELFFSHRKPLLKRSLILNSMNKQRSVRNQSNGILFFSWSGGPSALTSEESGQLEMARRLILDREIDSELVPGEQSGIHFHASLELRIAYAKRGGRPRGGRYWGVGADDRNQSKSRCLVDIPSVEKQWLTTHRQHKQAGHVRRDARPRAFCDLSTSDRTVPLDRRKRRRPEAVEAARFDRVSVLRARIKV